MMRRKEQLNNENKYPCVEPRSLFKQYFEVIPPAADILPSIIKENAKRRVESLQKMHQLAKENSPSNTPKKVDADRTEKEKKKEEEKKQTSNASSSSPVENDNQEMKLKLFLREMGQGRKTCELIFGHKQGTDLAQAKRLGVEASEAMPGCYKRNLDATITRAPDEWSEFVISYDNKFILNYTNHDIQTATAAGEYNFEFNHQTMGYGTFLKAAGKIKITENGKIIISPYSKYLELGWDYMPIILFVLQEKGLPLSHEDVLIADERGAVICFPEISPVSQISNSERVIPFYLNERRFPVAKAIALNKELDVEGILSKLFLSIDDSILSAKTKNDLSELTAKRNHLKTAIINLLLALTRNDVSNDLFKVTAQTIDGKLSEIKKHIELVKNTFGLSIKEKVEETIYHNLCEINKKIELMRNQDDAHLKKIFGEITHEKFLKLNTHIDIQAEKDKSNVNLKKLTEKSINEKLSEIKRNIESIKKAYAKKDYQLSNLKEFVDKAIYENLCAVNESILSLKNTDNVTLKEFTGKTARQHFYEVDEDIQLIKESHAIDLSFVKNELDIWLHYIFNLKFQSETKLGTVEGKTKSVLPEALSHIKINLKKIKAGTLPQRHIDEQDLINSPFLQFYDENPIKTCIALLRDYTKGGFFWRLLTGAWQRHHIKAVDQFLTEYENQHYPDNLSIQAIYRELFNLKEGALAEHAGKRATLFARLLFCEKLESGNAVVSAAPVVNEVSRQNEALNNLGSPPLSATRSAPIPIKQPEKPSNPIPSLIVTDVSGSSSVFYKEAPRDNLSPLAMPAAIIGEPTPPVATSSLKPGR